MFSARPDEKQQQNIFTYNKYIFIYKSKLLQSIFFPYLYKFFKKTHSAHSHTVLDTKLISVTQANTFNHAILQVFNYK